MRLIDADELKAYYVDLSTEKDIGYGDMGRMITVNINHIIKTIDDAPSIDIVRCKECIFADGDDKAEMYRCRFVSFPHWNKGEHFCSYGEREGE